MPATHLDGDDVGARPLIERKARLAELLSGAAPPLHYSDYHRGRGPASETLPDCGHSCGPERTS